MIWIRKVIVVINLNRHYEFNTGFIDGFELCVPELEHIKHLAQQKKIEELEKESVMRKELERVMTSTLSDLGEIVVDLQHSVTNYKDLVEKLKGDLGYALEVKGLGTLDDCKDDVKTALGKIKDFEKGLE